jgi:hypothetical protein
MTWSKELVKNEFHCSKDYFFDGKKWWYIGVLKISKMSNIAKKAYESWKDQGKRCTNPNSKDYEYYGAKGVKRIWSSRDCINWYINEILTRDLWIKPNVSRIGDLGNYKLGNVKLIEASENTAEIRWTEKKKEAARKNGKKVSKKILLTNIYDGNDILYFESGAAASEYLGKAKTSVCSSVLRKSIIRCGKKRYKAEYIRGKK